MNFIKISDISFLFILFSFLFTTTFSYLLYKLHKQLKNDDKKNDTTIICGVSIISLMVSLISAIGLVSMTINLDLNVKVIEEKSYTYNIAKLSETNSYYKTTLNQRTDNTDVTLEADGSIINISKSDFNIVHKSNKNYLKSTTTTKQNLFRKKISECKYTLYLKD